MRQRPRLFQTVNNPDPRNSFISIETQKKIVFWSHGVGLTCMLRSLYNQMTTAEENRDSSFNIINTIYFFSGIGLCYLISPLMINVAEWLAQNGIDNNQDQLQFELPVLGI